MERVNLSANGFYATPKCGYDFAMDLSDITAVRDGIIVVDRNPCVALRLWWMFCLMVLVGTCLHSMR